MLDWLSGFPDFNLSLIFSMRSSWSEPQSAPCLTFADCIGLLHLWLQEYSLISVSTIWWCPRVGSSLVLLEVGISYDQCVLTLLAFPLLHFVLQAQTCLLLLVYLDFLLQIVTAAMELKDTCSLEKNLWDLGSILKSRDITVLRKVCIRRAMFFPVVMYE